jgi:hypothetical protein
MTPIIFIAIGFLSWWFLLYTFVEWTQDLQYESPTQGGSGRKISAGEHGKQQQILYFRKKESRRETCV